MGEVGDNEAGDTVGATVGDTVGATVGDTGGDAVGATVGVEEEFHIVNPMTGAVVPAAARMLGLDLADAEPELRPGVVETATNVHSGLKSLRRDLVERRQGLADAAAALGLAVVTAGTVPDAGNRRGTVFPNERYEWMAEEYRRLVDEQQVCACQVHVSVADRRQDHPPDQPVAPDAARDVCQFAVLPGR
jgi:gamma-glutamyl:cysteine ligase YbdK (ATP-grasp superfamily)